MAKTPTNVLIATFTTDDGAGTALGTLKEAKKSQGLGIQNAAVLKMGDDRKLHIKETADMTGGKGMFVGGVVGGTLGLFGSAVFWPLGIGLAAGGLAAKLRDSGFPNQKLDQLGASLQPGSSVLVVAVDEGAGQAVEQTLQGAGAQVVREAIAGEVADQLETAASTSAQVPPTAQASASEQAPA
jgi:uncharacterized membrane protein